jgi:hypothetical protein
LVSGRLSLAFTGQRLAAVSVILCCLLVLGWAVTARMRFIPVSGPPVAVVLRASRGPGDSPAAAVPQGRAFILQADVTGLPDRGPCDLEIVDAEGRPVTRSRMRPEGGLMTAAVTGLGSGGYWVRLYAPGSRTELLQEYALRVE